MELTVGQRLYMKTANNDIKLNIIKKINQDYTIQFENETDTYLPLIESKILYNMTNKRYWKYVLIHNTLIEILGAEFADKFIWETILGIISNCNCMRCIRNKIQLLELALSFPSDKEIDAIINTHIIQSMLPRLKDKLFERMMQVIFMIGDSSFDDSSLDQGGNKRHPASENEVNLVSNIIKSCPENRKEEKCIFCLEKFSEMEQKVIECPGCHNIFCAKNSECQGFLRHLQEDRRCPTCRMDIKNWFLI